MAILELTRRRKAAHSWRTSHFNACVAVLVVGTMTLACSGEHRADLTPSASVAQLPSRELTATTTEPFEAVDATPAATTCDEDFGVVRVNQLFSALNAHDEVALSALFPAGDAGWDFEVQPDILAAATSANATGWASDIDVQSHQDLSRIMADFAGFHLVFTNPLHGGVVTETNPGAADRQVVAIGPVLWRGTSPSLAQRGKTAVYGGGKTAVDCVTGQFTRVLLGPLRYEP